MELDKIDEYQGNTTLGPDGILNLSESTVMFIIGNVLNGSWDLIPEYISAWQILELEEANSETGIKCLLGMWFNYNIELSTALHCNATWDDVYCWPPTPAGTELRRSCSETFKESRPNYHMYLEGDAIRHCLENGTWANDRTNYDFCAASFESYQTTVYNNQRMVSFVQQMLFYGSIFSLLCLSVSLSIFYYFKSLWCERLAIHVHLMLALVLRFILLLIITEPFVMKRSSNYRDVDILCKIFIVLYLFATVASVSWMLIQGVYLNNKLTMNVFSSDNRYHLAIYSVLGWILPTILIIIYWVTMVVNDHPEPCWRGYAEMDEIWILLIPMVGGLLLNSCFLINILRVVCEKAKSPNLQCESSRLMTAAKATVILFPVLGINNILLLYNPGGDYEKYYVGLNTFFGATQGIFVSIVYCFMSKEVHDCIRRSYNRFTARRSIGMMSRGGNHQNNRNLPLASFSELAQNHTQVETLAQPQLQQHVL